MIEFIQIGNCNFKVTYNNDLEKVIILRDSIIALGLLQNQFTTRIQIEKCCKELLVMLQNNKLDISFGYGYSSILYMNEFISKSYLKQQIDEYLILIEKIIAIFAKKNEPLILDKKFNPLFDYFKGLSGVYNYYLQFHNDQEIQELIINTLINSISITKYKKNDEINLSIAHGLSSIILILSKYMERHKFDLNQEEIISRLHDYILNQLKQQCIEKHELSVAWGNGELGILYSLVLFNENRKVKYNTNEYLDILKMILSKAHHRSINKSNICYGGVGTKFMLNKLKNFNKEMKNETDRYIFENFNFKPKGCVIDNAYSKLLSVGEYSIIDGALAEHILTSDEVNTSMLDKYVKYFMF